MKFQTHTHAHEIISFSHLSQRFTFLTVFASKLSVGLSLPEERAQNTNACIIDCMLISESSFELIAKIQYVHTSECSFCECNVRPVATDSALYLCMHWTHEGCHKRVWLPDEVLRTFSLFHCFPAFTVRLCVRADRCVKRESWFSDIFAVHFHWKKYKNDDDMVFAGACTKQTHSLMSGEHDL